MSKENMLSCLVQFHLSLQGIFVVSSVADDPESPRKSHGMCTDDGRASGSCSCLFPPWLSCLFHISCQLLGDLKGFLFPPTLMLHLYHEPMIADPCRHLWQMQEGRNYPALSCFLTPSLSTPNSDQHSVFPNSDILNIPERFKP